MDDDEIKKYPFTTSFLVYVVGFPLEEAEQIVRDHCKKRGISDEDCEKLLNIREVIQPESIVYDPPRLVSDERVMLMIFEGKPLTIQNLWEIGYSKEEIEKILTDYADANDFTEEQREKLFSER